MSNFEGPSEGENSINSGGFSFGIKMADLEQGALLKLDERKYWNYKQGESLHEEVMRLEREGIDIGEHLAARFQTLYESKVSDLVIDLGEMREALKDPVNRGRLNLHLTLSALEAGDVVDKVMTFVATLPPGIQEPILKFVASNPEALPITLLCSFAVFFAAKCVRYAEKGFSTESPVDSMGGVSVGPEAIKDVLALFKFEDHKN